MCALIDKISLYINILRNNLSTWLLYIYYYFDKLRYSGPLLTSTTSTLYPNVVYQFRVSAINAYGTSPHSEPAVLSTSGKFCV